MDRGNGARRKGTGAHSDASTVGEGLGHGLEVKLDLVGAVT